MPQATKGIKLMQELRGVNKHECWSYSSQEHKCTVAAPQSPSTHLAGTRRRWKSRGVVVEEGWGEKISPWWGLHKLKENINNFISTGIKKKTLIEIKLEATVISKTCPLDKSSKRTENDVYSWENNGQVRKNREVDLLNHLGEQSPRRGRTKFPIPVLYQHGKLAHFNLSRT